ITRLATFDHPLADRFPAFAARLLALRLRPLPLDAQLLLAFGPRLALVNAARLGGGVLSPLGGNALANAFQAAPLLDSGRGLGLGFEAAEILRERDIRAAFRADFLKHIAPISV